MAATFYKYQGTGNDFVIIDNRALFFPKEDNELVAFLCHRRFGIGADGLILLENDDSFDFRMVYYNSDGKEGSMCGNGGRCIVAFAKFLGIIDEKTEFIAVDGPHFATVTGDVVSLRMQDVTEIIRKPNASYLNTGSPHHVQVISDLKKCNVVKEGSKIRYGIYGEAGSNINFVEQDSEDTFNVRTYERGVEDETLSCGTGVTAVALAMHHLGKLKGNYAHINALGGPLKIEFEHKNDTYSEVQLIGEAKQVFKGEITW
ncbi:diaminopimelate epimerase [Maribacter litopenaei]|uniref:Diaminopimelate epimerase n=1 Tax=Maribacter litopenaei TaxID=2976127 RepID=A0ABY5YC54_9FLAO|nr:diaminopimelate epimerase [Maribacter litopenaei]UWX56591.1 diaminopimelate epimerase [Maribacter litopenaei]